MTENAKGARRARKIEKRKRVAREKREALNEQRRSAVDGSSTRWLKPEKCAEDLGVTKQHIFDLIATGKLKAKRFSAKVIRIAASEWDRFVTGAPDAAPAA